MPGGWRTRCVLAGTSGVAEQENGPAGNAAENRPADAAASTEVEEATILSVSDGPDPSAEDLSEQKIRRGVSRFIPAFGRKEAQPKPEPETGTVKQRNGGKGRGGLMKRIDSLVFFLVRTALFGLTAAACGILAVLFFRNFIDTRPGGPDLFVEFERLDAAVASAQEELQAVQAAQSETGPGAAEIESLRAEIAETGSSSAAAATALSARADRLEAALLSLTDSLEAVEDSIVHLDMARQAAPADRQLDELNSQLQDIRIRMDVLEAGAAASAAGQEQTGMDFQQPAMADNSRLLERIAGLEERLTEVDALRSQIDTFAARAADDTGPAGVAERLARLEASQPPPADLSPLETRLAHLEDIVRDLAHSGPVPAAQARGLSLIGVRAAAETGAPYASLLGNSGIAEEDIPEIVLAHANSGIATLESLRAEFGGYSRAVLKSPDTDTEGNRIAGVLRQLVQVRPLTPQEGEDPAAVLSRAEDALTRNDLSAALAQLEQLPAPHKEILAKWVGAAEARLAVLAEIDLMMNRTETQ